MRQRYRTWMILVGLFLGLAPAVTLAAELKDVRTYVHEDEAAVYWTLSEEEAVVLWSEPKAAGEEAREIMRNVLELYTQDGYLFVIKDAAPEENPGQTAIVYLVSWYQRAEGEWAVSQSFFADLPRFSEERAAAIAKSCQKAGVCMLPGGKGDGVYVLRTLSNGTTELRVYPIEEGRIRGYFHTFQLGKCSIAAYHQNHFFYYVNDRGSLLMLSMAELSPESLRPKGKRLATLPAKGVPMDGGTYLGWVTNKGVLGYTQDGKTKVEMLTLPKETSFYFFQEAIVAQYEDIWLGEIVPGQGTRPIDRERLQTLQKEKALPGAGEPSQ